MVDKDKNQELQRILEAAQLKVETASGNPGKYWRTSPTTAKIREEIREELGIKDKAYHSDDELRYLSTFGKNMGLTQNIWYQGVVQGKTVNIPGAGEIHDLDEFMARVRMDRQYYQDNWIQFKRAEEQRALVGTMIDNTDRRKNQLDTKINMMPSNQLRGGPAMDISLSRPLIGQLGRYGDTEVAHLTKGEVVLPSEVAAKLQNQIKNIMNKPNIDELTVGKGKINPKTGLEEFWQSGYGTGEDKEKYYLKWSDFSKWMYTDKYKGRERSDLRYAKYDKFKEYKSKLKIGKLDPKGDFTKSERKQYRFLSRALWFREKEHKEGRYSYSRWGGRPSTSYWQSEEGIAFREDHENWLQSLSAKEQYNFKRQNMTLHKRSLEKRLQSWERRRNKRRERELIAKQKQEEERLIREQEHAAGVQRAVALRTKRDYAKAMGRYDEGKITSRGEGVVQDAQDYSKPRYTSRKRKRSGKVANLGFFLNI